MSENLEQQLTTIQQIATSDPHVDAAALMMNALAQEQTDLVATKHKRWAYFIALGLPPLGYGVAIYYRFFSKSKDSFKVAWWCAGLTTFSIVLSVWSLHVILQAATQTTGQQFNLQQFQQLPTDLQNTLQ